MYKGSFFLFGIVLAIVCGVLSLGATTGNNNPPVYAWIGCDGTAVMRTDVGKITMTRIAKNLPNCTGPKALVTDSVPVNTPVTTPPVSASGAPVVLTVAIVPEQPRVPVKVSNSEMARKRGKIILDLSQKDIVNYRLEEVKAEQIRYANAIRSMRIRAGKSMESETSGYLIKNDAVKVTGNVTGWTPVRSGEVVITDKRENTISIDTSSGTSGYVGTRLLRNATPSDLVKLGQADIAYWTDLVHTEVSHLVNIRSNPWYTSPIVATVSSNVALYRTATVDNWSQVQSLDGAINGFIRSDYLGVDKAQLIEVKPLLK